MLTMVSIKNATNLARVLTSQNIKLVPKPGTLLAELSKSVQSSIDIRRGISNVQVGGQPISFTSDGKLNIDMINDMIMTGSIGEDVVKQGEKSYINSDHDALMDNYIQEMAVLFSNQIQYARNVVNAQMEAFEEHLTTLLNDFKPKDASDFFEIRYYDLDPLFNTDIISTEISESNSSISKPDLIQYNAIHEQSIDMREYLLTGDEETDKLIQNFVGRLIQSNKLYYYLTEQVLEYSLDIPNLLDYALINYLFYRVLAEKLDINMGMTSAQLRTKAFSNKMYFANKIKFALSSYKSNIANDMIFTNETETNFSYLNATKTVISVYNENFVKFAAEGGTLETLFGYITQDNNLFISYKKILARKEFFLESWASVSSLYLLHLNKNRLETFRQYLKLTYDEFLANCFTEYVEKESIKLAKGVYIDGCDEAFNEYSKKLTIENIDNVTKITLDIVAGIIFGFTNAYDLLKEMNSILATVTDIEPAQAALYSAIKYLTDYMMTQVDVVKI